MLIPFCGCDDNLIPLCPTRVERREAIAAEMARTAKASEASLPEDERRQVIDITEPVEFALVQSAPLIGDGQGRTADEIVEDSTDLLLPLGLAVVALLGIGAAELIARCAAAFGSAFLAN